MGKLIDRTAQPLPSWEDVGYRFAWGEGRRFVSLRGTFGTVRSNRQFWAHLFAAVFRRPIALTVEITLDEAHAAAIAARYAVERAKRDDPDAAAFFGMSPSEFYAALNATETIEPTYVPVRNDNGDIVASPVVGEV